MRQAAGRRVPGPAEGLGGRAARCAGFFNPPREFDFRVPRGPAASRGLLGVLEAGRMVRDKPPVGRSTDLRRWFAPGGSS